MWTERKLVKFENLYDSSHQDNAMHARGEFLRLFPKERLGRLSLRQYAIGRGEPTFCNYVEVKTRDWALIQGATALKFGVYFGRTSHDAARKYRFAKKFGQSEAEAFRGVKRALKELVHLGGQKTLDFRAIDANPLSQLFKAKILSLYFPDKFVAVCSAEHLDGFSEILKIQHSYVSEIQHRLAEEKSKDPRTRAWSAPKFMKFLYQTFLPEFHSAQPKVERPKKRKPRRVNFEDLQNRRNEIGRMAEEFALTWERERLIGDQMGNLADQILDCRDRPAYGYDFQSYNSPRSSRFIEVKAVAKVHRDSAYRFFLSENEKAVSVGNDCRNNYFFYLVFFEGGQPTQIHTVLASELYKNAELSPSAFIVRFEYQI